MIPWQQFIPGAVVLIRGGGVNQFADAELDPRHYAQWKRASQPAMPSARRSVLPAHCLAVMVGARNGRSLVPIGGEPFNFKAHAADIDKALQTQRAERRA